jgi:hypothetical protein
MNQSWTSHHDSNNQFYQGNSHPMGTTPNIPYDPYQYVHVQIPNTFMNQSQQIMLEERPSKKVQFARPIEQQVPSKNPLNSTLSWHEPSVTNTDVSTSTTRQDPVLTRQTVHRSLVPKTSISLTSASMQKPIYVGIDHRATLAERGQTTANKHHHKNNGDITNNNRTRPHTHHQHKHQEPNDSSNLKNNTSPRKSLEPLQVKLSGTNRPLTTTSTSTITPNKSIQHTEQPIFNDNEIKISKTRTNRNHTEQLTLIDNDTKPSRSRGNNRQQQQQQRTIINRNDSPLRTEVRRVENTQQSKAVNRNNSPLRTEIVRRAENTQQIPVVNRNNSPLRTGPVRRAENTQQGTAVNRNNSPLRIEIVRRGENMQQGTPIMRIPISQRQKQSTMPSTMIKTTNVTRTRV